MKVKKINRKAQRRLTMWSLFLMVILIIIILTLPNYIIQIIDKYQEKKELHETLESLKDEQDTLEREVTQLSDSAYVARIARQKYLFSKDGEMIVKINEQDKEEEKTDKTIFTYKINDNYVIIGTGVVVGLILLKKVRKKRTRRK